MTSLDRQYNPDAATLVGAELLWCSQEPSAGVVHAFRAHWRTILEGNRRDMMGDAVVVGRPRLEEGYGGDSHGYA